MHRSALDHLRAAADHAAEARERLRAAYDLLAEDNLLGADAVLSALADATDQAQTCERLAACAEGTLGASN